MACAANVVQPCGAIPSPDARAARILSSLQMRILQIFGKIRLTFDFSVVREPTVRVNVPSHLPA
eukprot:7547773-Pyramimonas_sp.AAC.1